MPKTTIEDWERFIEGQSPEGPLPPVLLDSWQRSHAAGVDCQKPQFRRVSDTELEQRLRNNAGLLAAATPHLEWLTATMTTIPHVVYLTDRDGIVLHAAGNMTESEISQCGLLPGYDWSESAMGTNGAGTAIASNQPVAVLECDHYCRAWHRASCTAAPIHDPEGRVIGAVDITTSSEHSNPDRVVVAAHMAHTIERDLAGRQSVQEADTLKALLAERERAEASYRAIFDAANDAILIHDLEQGAILDLNAKAREMFGYSAEEARALTVGSLGTGVPPYTCEDAWEHNRRAAQGEPQLFEWQAKDRSGRVFWVEVNLKRTTLNGEDRLLAVVRDISARKQTEGALRESETRFRTLGDFAPVGIFRMNGDGWCTYVNARWEEITGRSYEDGLGYGWLETLHPDDRRMLLEEWQQTAGQREGWSSERRVVTPNGEVRWIRVRARPVPSANGRHPEYIGTIEDVTERRRMDGERAQALQREQAARAEAQDANAAKDRFLAVLSHELRNPLSPILAGVQILRRVAPDNERVRRTVDAIERSAKLEARLVDDLLDLSRIGRGKITLQRAPVTLDAVVHDAVETQIAEVEKAGLTLRVDAVPGLWVLGDADRLQQGVMNLVSNSLKFTPPPGEIRIRVERADGCGRIVVEDTGIGIAHDTLPNLFTMFQQGDVAGKRKGGLGIGLALVKSFTEMHGGRVWAESDGPGKGSRFTVELPLTEAPGGVTEGERDGEVPDHMGVLLVEDNPDTLALLKDSLEILGYDVRAAASAEDALALLRQGRPDIILSDIGLPGIDGYEFLRRAHAMPGLADVPALALTGWSQPEDVQRAREAGYVGHFTKPVDMDVLDRRMRECRAVVRG